MLDVGNDIVQKIYIGCNELQRKGDHHETNNAIQKRFTREIK